MAEELEQSQSEQANIEPTQEQSVQPEEQQQEPSQGVPQPPSKASQLYQSLIKEGYNEKNLGKEQDFIKRVSDKANADKLYSSLISDGYNQKNLGSKDDFIGKLATTQQPPMQKGKQPWETSPLNPVFAATQAQAKKEEEKKIMPQPTPTVGKKAIPQRKPIAEKEPEEDGIISNVLGTTVDYTKHLWNKLLDGVGSVVSGAVDIQGITNSALINAAKAITGKGEDIDTDAIQKHLREVVEPKIKSSIKEIGQQAAGNVFGYGKTTEIKKEKEEQFNDNFLASSVAGLAEFAPAIPLGAIGMLAAGTDMGIQNINSTEAGKKLPESVKSIFGVTTGTATALLTQLKLDKIFGKQTEKVAAKLTIDALNGLLKESSEPITAQAFETAIQASAKSLKDKVVANGGKLLKAGGVGAAFGALNEATNLLAEDITNRATGKPVFDPTSFGKVYGRILHSTASMAVGGVVLGGVHIPFAQTENYIKNKVTEAKSPEDIINLKNEIAKQAQDGNTSPETADRINGLIDEYTNINSRIPIDTPNRAEAVDKIKQKDELKQAATDKLAETQNVDDAFHPQIIKEAEALNNRANEINDEITGISSEPIKESVYISPLEVPEVKEQIADLNRRAEVNDADGEVAKQELAQIHTDPIKFFEDRKEQAKQNLVGDPSLPATLENYDLIINKLKENDSKNKSRLSGEVGVGEKPVEAQPIEGGGTQEISGGGVLQTPGVEGERKAVESVGEKVNTKEDNTKNRIQELEKLPFDDDAKLKLEAAKEKGEERYFRQLKTEAGKLQEGNVILDRHKAEDILSNPNSTIEERVTAKAHLQNDAFGINGAFISEISRIIIEELSTVPPGEVKASWNNRTRELKKIYDAEIKEKQQAELPKQAEAPTPSVEAKPTEVVAKKEGVGEVKAEAPKQNKDNQTEFITSSGRQKVNRVGDEIVVTDAKTGNGVSRKTYNKAVSEYADTFDFTHGEEGESKSLDPMIAQEEVVESSSNPHQIASIYAENDVPFTEKGMTTEQMIADYGIGKTSIESYRRYGDINRLSRKMRANYIGKKGETIEPIDTYAKSLSDHYFPEGDGTEITPQDVIDFMYTFESKKELRDKKNPLLAQAAEKFKKLTGLNLTREIADKAISQKIEKESQAEQNLLNQEYGNAKELEDEYWRQYKATDGFTKEASAAEVNKGKEKIAAEEVKAEVPTTEELFKNAPKASAARDKYFAENFGENASKAEDAYQKHGKDYTAMAGEMEAKAPKAAEGGEGVPPTEKEEMPTAPLSPEEKWTAIKQEKLKEIESVRKVFEREKKTTWSKIQQDAMEDVAKEFPNKSLNDAIKTKVERIAAKYDAGEDYNPTAKDLAVIQEFKRQTERNIESSKEDLDSDNELDRFVAMAEIENYENDLLNVGKASFKREAGTAFGYRASESKMDENYGLTIRKAQLTRANGGEKLSEADNKFLESQWEKEKELMQKEQDIREQGLKDDFDKKIADLQKEYEGKTKIKDKTSQAAKQKTLSQKGKDVADQIRKLKLKGTKVDLSIGTWNLAIEGIAKLVEGGATIAEAIDTLIKDGTIGFKSSKDKEAFEDEFLARIKNVANKDVSFEKMKEIIADTKETNISNDMVKKGLIRDYVNSFVGEVEQSEVLSEATKGLKEIFPDINKKTLRSAYLKEGEFKQPTRQNIENSLTQEKRNLKRIELKESKKEATETEAQKKKLDEEKEKSKRDIKEYERKLKEGEFEKGEPTVLKKQDAELIQLNKQKNEVESNFRKKQRELEEKNKHWLQRAADFARSTYIAALIGSPVTLAKVAYMSIIRPTSEAIRKTVLGKVFDSIFPSISKAAERGGESPSIKGIQKGFEAYFAQMGQKKMERKFQEANKKYEDAAKKYEDALIAKADEKTLSQLKKDMNKKLLTATGNIMYQFIGGSSIKDAFKALVNRANEIEKQFGKTDIESIKDGNKLDKLNYLLGFVGRSHSAAKTFSGRFSYAAGFMARLEGAARDGSISDPNRIIEIAHESYIDWERGKYQQENWVTKKWNETLKAIRGKTAEKGEWSKYDKALEALLKTDVAITRVPVNIIHEAVSEYTLGAIRAPWLAYKEYAKAKGIATEEGYDKDIDSKEFKDRVKGLVSQMDANQAAKIFRLFTKGGLGLGLYGLAAMTGMVQFGVFPHKGQKKKKEEEYLKEGELNPGQIMIGKDRLGETASKLIEHTPALWTTFMGLGMAKIYADDVKAGKMTPQAAWDALYTHLEIIESSIPQSKVVSPLGIIKQTGKTFAGKSSSYGMFDKYIDAKGGFVNQEKKQLEMTTPEVLRLKDFGVEPPKLGVRSQNKIEVDAKHPKEGISKDGKPYAYMSDLEWSKFNEYRKDYINEALKELYNSNDAKEIKLTQQNLTDALTTITRQGTTVAKNKLVDEGLLPEKNKEEEENDIKDIIKDIYENAKP